MDEHNLISIYKESIEDILGNNNFIICNTDIGLDIKSNKLFNVGDVLYIPNKIIKIKNNDLIDKYGAYIWNDNYIISGFGMLLNNKDEKNSDNCTYNNITKSFVASKIILPGDSIRIDYKMNTNEYPPIPEEIIHLRSTMVV